MADYPTSDLNGWAGHDIPEPDEAPDQIELLRKDLLAFTIGIIHNKSEASYLAYRLYQMGWRKNGS